MATDVGFFASFLNPAQTDLSIVYSTNGIEWQTVQPPPIWPQPGEPLPFASDTVMTIGDDLVAFVHRGDVEGWGVVEDPTTEIWRAALPSLEGS